MALATPKLPQSHCTVAGIGCPRAGAKLWLEELKIPDLDLIKQAQQGAGASAASGGLAHRLRVAGQPTRTNLSTLRSWVRPA